MEYADSFGGFICIFAALREIRNGR